MMLSITKKTLINLAYFISIVCNATSVMGTTVFVCSSKTLCNSTYSNIMIKILKHTTVHYCPDLHDAFTSNDNPETLYVPHSLIHDILFDGDPKKILSEYGINNVSNIIVGPEVTHQNLLYKKTNNFSSHNKLIKSDGDVSIVDRRSIHVGIGLGYAISSACSLLVISLLLAPLAAMILLYAVSVFILTFFI